MRSTLRIVTQTWPENALNSGTSQRKRAILPGEKRRSNGREPRKPARRDPGFRPQAEKRGSFGKLAERKDWAQKYVVGKRGGKRSLFPVCEREKDTGSSLIYRPTLWGSFKRGTFPSRQEGLQLKKETSDRPKERTQQEKIHSAW